METRKPLANVRCLVITFSLHRSGYGGNNARGIGRAGMVKVSLVSFTPLPLPAYGLHASAFPW